MKLLLALDASRSSEAVIRQVLSRPWPEETVIGVLSVVNPKILDAPPAQKAELVKEELDAAHRLVKFAEEQLGKRGFEATTAVVEGDPATVIVEYTRLWNIDLTFLGAVGKSKIEKFFIGKVAKTVFRDAPCSVEIVRRTGGGEGEPCETGRNPMNILTASDGSPYGEAAVRSIAERPWPEGSVIRVISVAEPSASLEAQFYDHDELWATLSEEIQASTKKAVHDALHILTSAGLKAAGEVVIGSSKDAIVEEAIDWNADLIVLGTSDKHGFQRIFAGSTSDFVAIHAPCSVEVIRRKG